MSDIFVRRTPLTIIGSGGMISIEYGNFCMDYNKEKELITVTVYDLNKTITLSNITEKQFKTIQHGINNSYETINIVTN